MEKLDNDKNQNLHQMKDQETGVEYSTYWRATTYRRALVGKSERKRTLRKRWAKYGSIRFATRPAI